MTKGQWLRLYQLLKRQDNITIETNMQKTEEETSLLFYLAILWRRKWLIIIITALAVLCVILYSVYCLENYFSSESSILIDNRSQRSNVPGAVYPTYAGVELPITATQRYSDLAIFLAGTNSLFDSIGEHFELNKKFVNNKYPKESVRKLFRGSLKAEFNDKSSVLILSYTHVDPVFASEVVNYSTMWIENRFDELGLDRNKLGRENIEANIAITFDEIHELEEEARRLQNSVAHVSYPGGIPVLTRDINRINVEIDSKRQVNTQLKTQLALLDVNLTNEKPIFQILEMAEVPEIKAGPSRGKICIIVTLAAFLFSVCLAFLIEAIRYYKKDPKSVAYFQRIKT